MMLISPLQQDWYQFQTDGEKHWRAITCNLKKGCYQSYLYVELLTCLTNTVYYSLVSPQLSLNFPINMPIQVSSVLIRKQGQETQPINDCSRCNQFCWQMTALEELVSPFFSFYYLQLLHCPWSLSSIEYCENLILPYSVHFPLMYNQ